MKNIIPLSGIEYDVNKELKIVNMQQNYFYLTQDPKKENLLDIIPGYDNRLLFVWKKSKRMFELYGEWCNRKQGT